MPKKEKPQKGKINVVKMQDVRRDVVGTCDCCGVEMSSTEDRWVELHQQMEFFMDHHKPHYSCVHEFHKYKRDEFPKEYSQLIFEGMENHVPRNVLDVNLLEDILEKYPDDQEIDYLKTAFRKYDAIYGKAHKQWLRYLMNECHEHGLFDGGDDEDIVT